MGCASSKVDNEEIVSRCRDRKRLMRQAVNSRHSFAAAHSAYLRALRQTGAALKQFAEGESMVISAAVTEETPASLLPEYRPRQMKFEAPPPPPPPPPPPFEMSPNPSIQSSGFSSRRIPHILSSSENSRAGSPPPPPPPPPPPGVARDRTGDDYWASSQYSGTPSYQGSMWNAWEPFGTPPPPSPRIHTDEHGSTRGGFYRRSKDRSADDELDDSSTDAEDENEQTREPDSEPEVENSMREAAKSPAREVEDISSMVSRYTRDTDMQMIISRKRNDLGEIVRDLDEYFLMASSAGKEVSRILETSRTQFEFGQPTKKVYHSANMFSVLSWTWSSKPPLAIRYTLEPADAGAHSSHCSTLERLLAWEKKLYAEVRSGEATKIEQEKKLALLQNQEVKGENEIKVNKTRASIKRLQSLIMVAGQAVNTTSVAIIKLRENELWPQLVELSEGLMQMWRTMNGCHKIQNQIVEQVKHLETLAGREATSDHHHDATRQLEVQVREWYNSFCSLIKSQREYMRALFGWVRLSLIQLDNEATRGLGKPPPIYSLCEEWQQALERLPDKAASEAIKSFIAVVHAIVVQQAEEQKHKKKSESLSKELQRKMISLRDIENKYYSSYSLPDRSRGASDSGYEFDPRDPLAGKRAEIDAYKRRVEDEKSNHLKSVQVTRAMTLNNIRTGLPGVFQAMASFSSVCMHAFETVYNQTKSFSDHSSVRMLE